MYSEDFVVRAQKKEAKTQEIEDEAKRLTNDPPSRVADPLLESLHLGEGVGTLSDLERLQK